MYYGPKNTKPKNKKSKDKKSMMGRYGKGKK